MNRRTGGTDRHALLAGGATRPRPSLSAYRSSSQYDSPYPRPLPRHPPTAAPTLSVRPKRNPMATASSAGPPRTTLPHERRRISRSRTTSVSMVSPHACPCSRKSHSTSAPRCEKVPRIWACWARHSIILRHSGRHVQTHEQDGQTTGRVVLQHDVVPPLCHLDLCKHQPPVPTQV